MIMEWMISYTYINALSHAHGNEWENSGKWYSGSPDFMTVHYSHTATPEPQDCVPLPHTATPEPQDCVPLPHTATPKPQDCVPLPHHTATPEPQDCVPLPMPILCMDPWTYLGISEKMWLSETPPSYSSIFLITSN